ncbi:hypothetical protein LT493_25795 [Streptomyces tricolor]|nr:hypothetical protein [Streptomyces tricolor]
MPGDLAGQRAAVLASLRAGFPEGFTDARLSRMLDVMVHAVAAGSRREPSPFKGDLLLFTSTRGRAEPGAMADAWRPVVTRDGGESPSRLHARRVAGRGTRCVVAGALGRRLRDLDTGPRSGSGRRR